MREVREEGLTEEGTARAAGARRTWHAVCSGVPPDSPAWLTLAPATMSALAQPTWPFWQHTRSGDVRLSRALFTDAPAATSSRTHSWWPS